MKWLAPLLLGFVLFTSPNGQTVWIEPSQVVAVQACRPYPKDACAPNAKAQIVTLGGNIYVADPAADVIAKLTDGGSAPKPKGK